MSEVTFERWIEYLFNREQSSVPWYYDEDEPIFLPARQFIRFGTELFTDAGKLLSGFTDAQVQDGLYRIVSNNFSDEIFALRDEAVPIDERRGFVSSVYWLNRDCFAVRCTPTLAHLDEPGASPLNEICYMWWDISIICGEREPALEPLNEACFEVMEKCLELANVAVQEGALHGLGHFCDYYPERCRALIDSFLEGNKEQRVGLRDYAESAKTGCVL